MFAPIFLGKNIYARDMSHAKADNMSLASPDFGYHYGSWKIRAKLFFFKIPNFLVIQPKNISITLLEHLETNSSTQNTQKHSKN
jgi:hypothetical protein